MISGRDISDLAETILRGVLSEDLHDVIVWPPSGDGIPLAAPVEITLHEGKLCCRIRLFENSPIPELLGPLLGNANMKTGVIEMEACYRITGTTAEGTEIELENVWPGPMLTNTTVGASSTRHFHFNRLKLPPRGYDTQSTAQIMELLGAHEAPASAVAQEPEPRKPPMEEFAAIIPGVKLLLRPHGTQSKLIHPYHGEATSSKCCCLIGEACEGTFCLEDKDGDLWVFYRRQIFEGEPTAPSARQVFSGILDAVGFMNVCCPWPYYLEHRRDHRVIERWLAATKDCIRDTLPPMSKGRLHFGAEAQTLFRQAAEFFSGKTEEAELFTRSLWLIREACQKGMPLEIRLITLCSVIEGLIHHFENTLLSAEEKQMNRREKWQAITSGLSLPWTGVFDIAFERWDFFRHPLAHGFQRRTDATGEMTFQAYSRITAAIYLLMASRMGYRGAIDSSVMEDGRTISIGG
jgi:hypothetical protein